MHVCRDGADTTISQLLYLVCVCVSVCLTHIFSDVHGNLTHN